MQVKCFLQLSVSTIFPDMAEGYIARQGTALLANWITKDSMEANTILITSGDFHVQKESDILFILGGRRSIVDWLKLQNKSPKIKLFNSSSPLYATILRKHQVFDKNLTMVCLTGISDLRVHSKDWKLKTSADLRRAGQPFSIFDPVDVADGLERIFAGELA